MSTETIKDTLDSVQALAQMRPSIYGTAPKHVLQALADSMDSTYGEVHSWVMARRFQPRADRFMEIQEWNEKMVKHVNRDKHRKAGYRLALEGVKRQK